MYKNIISKFSPLSFFILLFLMTFNVYSVSNRTHIAVFDKSPLVDFSVNELAKVLKHECTISQSLENNDIDQIVFSLKNDRLNDMFSKSGIETTSNLESEGFEILKSTNLVYVFSNDFAGLMYGGFELAEIIQTKGWDAIQNVIQNPYMKMRGTKFNIPLDVRTPSYSDVSDAAQINMPEMWDFDFWREYIDTLAKYRYNYVSLWSLHPFPSLIKIPEYPDIALDDVRRSTVNWKEHYNLNGHHFDAPEITENFETLKTISIDEKIEFWRKVMRYGKERNIDFYFVTWNIFVNGTDGKYGITDRIDNPVTRDYFRSSVREMFLTYPDLAGIGLTTGENMYGYSTEEKEDWAFSTYGKGVLDVLKQQPDRKITFIHRQHQTGALDVADQFKPLVDNPNINFIFSFKYAKAHVYSSVNQVYHQQFVQDIQNENNLKTIWTLRNDDIFHFRWGAPDYVREFIKNIPSDVSEGYYYGSDQYIWGREFLSKFPTNPRQLEISKHWYHWMLWGRLGYDPNLTNKRFKDILHSRFSTINIDNLFNAWQHASMIYPLTTGFHWGALDFQWYIESGQSRPDPAQTPSGYHDVNRFITLQPHKGTGYSSISDFVQEVKEGQQPKGISPLVVAQEIRDHAHNALKLVNTIDPTDSELRVTIDDIKTMSFLGLYYSHKIAAATELALFRHDFKNEHYNAAIKNLNQSAGFWRKYASLALFNNNNPLWTNRVGYVDWRDTYRYVIYDITANGGELDIPSMLPSTGGTILEAEDAEFHTTNFDSSIQTCSGRGYLNSRFWDARQSVTWEFNAPETGKYILEFRYSLKRQNYYDSSVLINDKNAGELFFWQTGNANAWVWDRIAVQLNKGENKINISPEGFVLLDCLNVIKM